MTLVLQVLKGTLVSIKIFKDAVPLIIGFVYFSNKAIILLTWRKDLIDVHVKISFEI